MSDVYTSQPLVVWPWCNHAATTVGYINDKGHFTPLADCNLGPGYAVDYEPLARLLASAPELLAALNAALDDVDAHWSVGCEPPEWAEQARAAVAKADGDKS